MTVPSFTEFLAEGSSAGKLTHLQHLEDLLLDDGIAGVDFALTLFDEFYHLLKHGGVSTGVDLRTKWDGAPSMVFGPDPNDKRFFVATKAAFSKAPKLMKSHQDIETTYGSAPISGLMHSCLSELALLRPSMVLQGDLLFSPEKPPVAQMIDGRSHLTFQPNTITYAVDAESSLGKRIQRAVMGIVIHTMYKGSGRDFSSYSASPVSASIYSQLAKTSRVVTIDSRFDDLSGTATFTTSEESDYLLAVSKVRELRAQVPVAVAALFAEPNIHPLIQKFFNHEVRQGTFMAPDKLFTRLMVFFADQRAKEVTQRSSAAGQQAVTDRFNTMMTSLRTHVSGVVAWFALHTAISRAKLLIIRKLDQVSKIGTFIQTANGLQHTGPEGYVATSHAGKMIKLVDRLTFSRNNFLLPKQW